MSEQPRTCRDCLWVALAPGNRGRCLLKAKAVDPDDEACEEFVEADV